MYLRLGVLVSGVGLISLCGCGDAGGDGQCIRFDDLRCADGGLSQAHDPRCNPLLAEYDLSTWREPNTPSQPEGDEGSLGGAGSTLSFYFPPDANTGLGSTVWLTDDEPLTITFVAGLGEAQADPASARAVLLIDGETVPFAADDDAAEMHVLSFAHHPGEFARHTLVVRRR